MTDPKTEAMIYEAIDSAIARTGVIDGDVILSTNEACFDLMIANGLIDADGVPTDPLSHRDVNIVKVTK